MIKCTFNAVSLFPFRCFTKGKGPRGRPACVAINLPFIEHFFLQKPPFPLIRSVSGSRA